MSVTKTKYIPSIGIECHVQLKTKTKLFSAVANDAREAAANTLISHIDLGMPGALPVLNEQAVHYALRMAYAFNVEPQKHSIFERKHYFYPDLPKGYQITQLTQPIIQGGYVELENGTKVHLNRVQIEEDAGKNIHPTGADYSLVDLNRAGTPLLEIVSEPDMHTAAEAKAYARELYLLVRYADVSDADLFHGNMRFDVNVSLSSKDGVLGIRTETKNINSFRSVEKAVEYEIKRQTEELERGNAITQETRGWDDAKQKTLSQRGKEEAHDYRYMPEPDIPPLQIDAEMANRAKQELPIMPSEWRRRLEGLNLDKSQIETLLDAQVENEGTEYLGFIEEHLNNKENKKAKAFANWFVNIEIPAKSKDLSSEERSRLYNELYSLFEQGKLGSTNLKLLLQTVLQAGAVPGNLAKFAQDEGYIQVSDESTIKEIVKTVLASNPQAAADVSKGEVKAIGFLVGQVMKASQGKANPELAQKLIKQQLAVE